MKTFALGLGLALALAASAASAQTTPAATAPMACQQQLADLQKIWSDDMPVAPSKPAPSQVVGKLGHVHSGIDYNYMVRQFRAAEADCNSGLEHDAMLHMDVIRAVMRLPAVAHPAAHNYQPMTH